MLENFPRPNGGQNILIADAEKTQPHHPQGQEHLALRRTKELFCLNFRPIPGISHPKPYDSIIRFILTFRLSAVAIGVIGYSFVWYWWILSVVTMVPAAYPNYSPLIQGLLFLGLFLGTIFSEIFCSGRLSDYIVDRLAKKNGNVRVAEMRLWLAYPAIVLTGSKFSYFFLPSAC